MCGIIGFVGEKNAQNKEETNDIAGNIDVVE